MLLEEGGTLEDAYAIDQSPYKHLETFDELAAKNAGRVFEAMEQAGTPCPYKGKIGIEAAKAWAENPEKRPDYDKWLKENDLEAYEKEWQNKATTWGIGIGAILLLLL